jgi:hypothetical protein
MPRLPNSPGRVASMKKIIIFGIIVCLWLPVAASGQDNHAGEKYMGSQMEEKQCPAASAPSGPFPCPYPLSPYPPLPAGPPMTEQLQAYQAKLDESLQIKQQQENETRKKAIEQIYQQEGSN